MKLHANLPYLRASTMSGIMKKTVDLGGLSFPERKKQCVGCDRGRE